VYEYVQKLFVSDNETLLCFI